MCVTIQKAIYLSQHFQGAHVQLRWDDPAENVYQDLHGQTGDVRFLATPIGTAVKTPVTTFVQVHKGPYFSVYLWVFITVYFKGPYFSVYLRVFITVHFKGPYFSVYLWVFITVYFEEPYFSVYLWVFITVYFKGPCFSVYLWVFITVYFKAY